MKMADAFLKANLGESEVEAVALILERTKSLLLDAKKLLPADKADQILEGWTQLSLHGKIGTCQGSGYPLADISSSNSLDFKQKVTSNSQIHSSNSSVPASRAKLPSSDGSPSSVQNLDVHENFQTPRDNLDECAKAVEDGPRQDGLLESGLFDPQPPVTYDYLAKKNGHERDARLTFHAGDHKYFLDDDHTFGVSVTGVCGNFGDDFKTDLIIHRMMKGKNWPREEYMVADGSGEMRAMTKAEIKQKWDFGRDDAGNRGTYMHSLIEWLLTDPRTMMYTTEIKMFFNFYEEHLTNITPYRLEWRIFDEDLDVAGSVDFVGKMQDGTFCLVDWKRSKEIKFEAYNNKKMKEPFKMLPDSNFGKFSLQLNLYKMLLERNYGLVVSKMMIAVFHPNCNEIITVDDLKLGVVDGTKDILPFTSTVDPSDVVNFGQ